MFSRVLEETRNKEEAPLACHLSLHRLNPLINLLAKIPNPLVKKDSLLFKQLTSIKGPLSSLI